MFRYYFVKRKSKTLVVQINKFNADECKEILSDIKYFSIRNNSETEETDIPSREN